MFCRGNEILCFIGEGYVPECKLQVGMALTLLEHLTKFLSSPHACVCITLKTSTDHRCQNCDSAWQSLNYYLPLCVRLKDSVFSRWIISPCFWDTPLQTLPFIERSRKHRVHDCAWTRLRCKGLSQRESRDHMLIRRICSNLTTIWPVWEKSI